MTSYADNILQVYNLATSDEVNEGLNWYNDARNKAIEWSNGDVWKGAGVIAAYSPVTDWDRNLELAKSSLLTGIARTDTLQMNVRKARAILNGANVLETLKGPKTTAFASAIADPNTDLIAVDSHAYSIAMGEHFYTSQAKFPIRIYRAIAQAYRDVAQHVGERPIDLQAITWVSWRNAHPRKGKGRVING